MRINALAPQDVNWDERDNLLLHLDALPVLGEILRAYAIKLYVLWSVGWGCVGFNISMVVELPVM